MKKIIYIILCLGSYAALAQDFDKNLVTARTSYGSGDLENARFAMEQMLRDLDMAIGKEILKLLPTQLGAMKVNEKDDNLSGGAGYGGLFVHRGYGADPKRGSIEIINNSPLINSIQSIMTMPLIGGMMRDENQKQIKVQGYKSLLNKQVNTETGKINYELQIPMNNTLLTVKMDDTSEADITQVASKLELAKIVQMAQ